jgi:Zn-dependent protease with chaperone function
LRVPRDSGLEPQVIASIERYRRRSIALRWAGVVPLMAGVVAALTTYLYVLADDGALPYTRAQSWLGLSVIALILVILVLLVGPEKLPVITRPDNLSLNVFQNALEGVSVAAGLDPPQLLVLDLPTTNSIALFHADKPAVAITAEALEASLPRRVAEAMMAHELSHVLLGDVVIGISTRRWRLLGLSLVALLVLPFVLLALAFGFGAWTYVGLLGWTALTVVFLRSAGPVANRQHDLLADSVAARMTGDPGALKQAVQLLDGMFLQNKRPFASGARYPQFLFSYENRPEVDLIAIRELIASEDDTEETREASDRDLLKYLRKKSAFHRESTAARIDNLEAIERGHWPAFER